MGKRKPQKPKGDRNEALGRAFIELRQGSRTTPHRNKAKYTRKAKYQEW
jgi:hypothetical protein